MAARFGGNANNGNCSPRNLNYIKTNRNLRKLTNRENICRSKVSKYGRGVHYFEKINKYGACIQINKIQYHLGVFCDVEDARNAYDKALSDWNDNGILPYKRDRTVKKCNACNEVKSVSEFYYIKGHGYQYMCKECQKKYGKEYRLKKKKMRIIT